MRSKILTIGLAIAFPLMAGAQSSTNVTLYGTIDTGVEYVNNIADGTGGANSSVHFNTLTSSVPSNWGLRGTEDLGNGLSAIFTLESGFTPGTGVQGQGGRLFGRQAWAGLKGDWGQIAFGRQYNMLFWGTLGANLLGPNSQGLGGLDNYIPNARMDNAITYRGSFDGFKLGAAWARGRDTVSTGGPAARGCGVDYTDSSACQAYSFMMGYDSANWGVASAYDVIQGGDTSWPGSGLSNPDHKDIRWTINGYVKFDALKIGALYLNRKNEGGILSNPVPGAGSRTLGNRSDLWSLSATYQFTPAFALDGAVNHLNYKNASDSSKTWQYVARVRYALSKRTTTYLSTAYVRNKGDANVSASSGSQGASPDFGASQTAVMVGLRHSF
ncbi:porin [Pusillimonas sp.]|uniref:porin n=1 Tax=Pusillimonas sp. TaxID=3040095 RepID=UPI0037CA995C